MTALSGSLLGVCVSCGTTNNHAQSIDRGSHIVATKDGWDKYYFPPDGHSSNYSMQRKGTMTSLTLLPVEKPKPDEGPEDRFGILGIPVAGVVAAVAPFVVNYVVSEARSAAERRALEYTFEHTGRIDLSFKPNELADLDGRRLLLRRTVDVDGQRRTAFDAVFLITFADHSPTQPFFKLDLIESRLFLAGARLDAFDNDVDLLLRPAVIIPTMNKESRPVYERFEAAPMSVPSLGIGNMVTANPDKEGSRIDGTGETREDRFAGRRPMTWTSEQNGAAPSEAKATKPDAGVSQKPGSGWLPYKVGERHLGLLTIEIAAIESDDAGKRYERLAALLKDNQKDLSKAISDWLVKQISEDEGD